MPVTEAWIDSVYRCATGDAPWEVAVRPLMQETGTFCCGGVNHTIMPLTADIVIGVDTPPELSAAYEKTLVHENPLIDLFSSLSPGKFMTGLSRPGSENEPNTFKEDLATRGVSDTLWISIAKRPGEFFMLPAPRMPQAGFFTKEDLDKVQPYVPHLVRGFEIWLKLNLYKAENEWVSTVMDQVPNGMITLGPERTIFYTNKAAEIFLSSMKGAQRKMLRLHFADTGLDLKFQTILDALPNVGEDNVLILRRGRGTAPVLLRVEPAGATKGESNLPKAVAVIHIIDPDARVLRGLSALAHSYGLTAAETRVFEKVVETGSVIEAGVEAGVAESTARTHMKSIHGKLETKTLGQLLLKIFKATLQ
jgi:DNA-binding CsgD family transcriptional regulator